MTASDLTSKADEHFTFNVLSGLYFVNHLLICVHRRRSLASFSCNRCLVQCVSSRAEFDDDDVDDDGQDASDHDDDDGGGDFDDGQDFVGVLDV